MGKVWDKIELTKNRHECNFLMLFYKGDSNAPDSKYTLILNTFIHEFIKASQ